MKNQNNQTERYYARLKTRIDERIQLEGKKKCNRLINDSMISIMNISEILYLISGLVLTVLTNLIQDGYYASIYLMLLVVVKVVMDIDAQVLFNMKLDETSWDSHGKVRNLFFVKFETNLVIPLALTLWTIVGPTAMYLTDNFDLNDLSESAFNFFVTSVVLYSILVLTSAVTVLDARFNNRS